MTTIEQDFITHDFTWMPRDPQDCPCLECIEYVDREARVDREAMWPHQLDWHIQKSSSDLGICPCGRPIDSVEVYNYKRKTNEIVPTEHVLVEVFSTRDIGDGVEFPGINRVRLHLHCARKSGEEFDMETRARDVLLIESLSPIARRKLQSLYRDPA